jgi:hypothetical protein
MTATGMCEQIKAGLRKTDEKTGGQCSVLECVLLKTADRRRHAGSNLAGGRHVNQWDPEENPTKKAQRRGLQ